MIKSRRELAIALTGKRSTSLKNVSKKLLPVVERWIKSKDIKLEGDIITGNY